MDTFFWRFVKDSAYVPPLPMALKELKTQTTTVCAKTDYTVLH
jgi:hypothetical protein